MRGSNEETTNSDQEAAAQALSTYKDIILRIMWHGMVESRFPLCDEKHHNQNKKKNRVREKERKVVFKIELTTE